MHGELQALGLTHTPSLVAPGGPPAGYADVAQIQAFLEQMERQNDKLQR